MLIDSKTVKQIHIDSGWSRALLLGFVLYWLPIGSQTCGYSLNMKCGDIITVENGKHVVDAA